MDRRTQLNRLHPEQESLERHRRDLAWQERARRYHIQDEIVATEGAYKQAVTELKDLGLALVDVNRGPGGLPDPDQRPAGRVHLAAGRGQRGLLELRGRGAAAADPDRVGARHAAAAQEVGSV